MTAVDIKDTDLMQNKKEESDAIGLMSIVNDVFTVMFNEVFFFFVTSWEKECFHS